MKVGPLQCMYTMDSESMDQNISPIFHRPAYDDSADNSAKDQDNSVP